MNQINQTNSVASYDDEDVRELTTEEVEEVVFAGLREAVAQSAPVAAH